MRLDRLEALIISAESKLMFNDTFLSNAVDTLNKAEKDALLTKWHSIADAWHILNKKG
jgi:hypothetical protein